MNRLVTGTYKMPVGPGSDPSLLKLLDEQSEEQDANPKTLKKLSSIENHITQSPSRLEEKKSTTKTKKTGQKDAYVDPNNYFSILA